MPIWRCPHCQTPQPESSRCWVCKRSSTSCGTCRHFRRAIAGQFGFCALDRQRLPLIGDEIRGCWEEADRLATSAPIKPHDPDPVPRLDFVPVESRSTRVISPPPVAFEPPAFVAATPVAPPPAEDARSGFWDD